MHGTSGSHAAKNFELGKDSCKVCTKMPIILPKDAPIAMEGTKIPAGTLHPYDMMTRKVRNIVANASESTMDHLFFALRCLVD